METKPRIKADFVRSLPKSMPASKVVEAGLKVGLKLSVNYVYVVRSQIEAGGPPAISSARPASAEGISLSEKERMMVEIAAELGLVRTEEILRNLRARLRSGAVERG